MFKMTNPKNILITNTPVILDLKNWFLLPVSCVVMVGGDWVTFLTLLMN